MNEVKLYFDSQFEDFQERALKRLIDWLRKRQEDFDKDISIKVSGLEILYQMFQMGDITMKMYLSIKDAVEFYSVPYKLNIIRNDQRGDKEED